MKQKMRENFVKKPLFDHPEFWTFSIQTYSMEGVKENCLWLQDNERADVNLLLLMAWLDSKGVALTKQQIQDLKSISEKWQETVLRPLRISRKAILKSAPEYKQALASELDAEKQAQYAFIDYLNDSSPAMPTDKPASSGNNLESYALQAGLSMVRVKQLLASARASAPTL